MMAAHRGLSTLAAIMMVVLAAFATDAQTAGSENGSPDECGDLWFFETLASKKLDGWTAHETSQLATFYEPIQSKLLVIGSQPDASLRAQQALACLSALLQAAPTESAAGLYAELAYFNFKLAPVASVHPFEELQLVVADAAKREPAGYARAYDSLRKSTEAAIYLDDIVQYIVFDLADRGADEEIAGFQTRISKLERNWAELFQTELDQAIEMVRAERKRRAEAEVESCKRLRAAGIDVMGC